MRNKSKPGLIFNCGFSLEKGSDKGLTLWLPQLDIICLYTPGNALQVLHMRRKPQHSVEMTNSHRITQLV